MPTARSCGGVDNPINMSHAFLQPARIFLAGAKGLTKAPVARRGFGTGGRNVTQAISRQRIQGSHNKFRPGRPGTHHD